MSKPNIKRLLLQQKTDKKIRKFFKEIEKLDEKQISEKLEDDKNFAKLLELPEGFVKKAVAGFLKQKKLFLAEYVKKFSKDNMDEIEKKREEIEMAREMVRDAEEEEIRENVQPKKKLFEKEEEILKEFLLENDPAKYDKLAGIMKKLRTNQITIQDINRDLKKKYGDIAPVLEIPKKKTIEEAREAMKKIKEQVAKEKKEKYSFLKEEIEKLKKDIEKELDPYEKKSKERDLSRMQKTYEKLVGIEPEESKSKRGTDVEIAKKTIDQCKAEYTDSPWISEKTRGIRVAYAGSETELPSSYEKYFKTGFNPEILEIAGTPAKTKWWKPTRDLYKILCIYAQKQQGNTLRIYLSKTAKPLLFHIAYLKEEGGYILQNGDISKKRNDYKKGQRMSKYQIMEELAKSNLVSSTSKNIVKGMFSKILTFLSPNNDEFKMSSEFLGDLIDEIPIVDDTIYDFFETSSKILSVLYNPDFEDEINNFTINDFKALVERDYKESEKNKILSKMLYEYYYITHPHERVEYRIQLNPYNFLSRRGKEGVELDFEMPARREVVDMSPDAVPIQQEDKEESELSSLFSKMFLNLENYEKGIGLEPPEEEVVEIQDSDDDDLSSELPSDSDDSSISSDSSSEDEEMVETPMGEQMVEMPKVREEIGVEPESQSESESEDASGNESEELSDEMEDSSIPSSTESSESWLKSSSSSIGDESSSGKSTGEKCFVCEKSPVMLRTMVKGSEPDTFKMVCFCSKDCAEQNKLRKIQIT